MSDADLLAKSADDLDLEIGRTLLADQLGSKDVTDSEAKAAARRWLAANLDGFRRAVCTNAVVRGQLMAQTSKTRNELFAAVLDALLKVGGGGIVPVATLSARLIHYGLDRLCAERPETSGP
ncbi:MAG: hypothetical protein HY660_03850 [Armatimonadetes bacterium]|nr:hypothetical protein [Armatimonadota bacterium]